MTRDDIPHNDEIHQRHIDAAREQARKLGANKAVLVIDRLWGQITYDRMLRDAAIQKAEKVAAE